jgi:phosphate transport system substrate-binding protein
MTAGNASVVVTSEYVRVLEAEAKKFADVYPDVKFIISGTTTREAIVSILNEQTKTVCVDRMLNDEERGAARDAHLPIVETVIGFDALAIIVNPRNSVEQMSKATLRDIVWGKSRLWSQVPGSSVSGTIELTLTGKNSGTYELLQKRFFPTTSELAATSRSQNSIQCAEYVSTRTGALSFVPFTAVASMAKAIRVVAVEADSGWTKSEFVRPTQLEVYKKTYPFHFELVHVNAERRQGVGAGLGTFILTTAGQRIIQNAGLVPAHLPYHAIQLTSDPTQL